MRWAPWIACIALFAPSCGSQPAPPKPPPPLPPLATTETIDVPPPRDDGRLPPGVRPTRYALDLSIDPAKPTFTGRTRIAVKLAAPARAIVLHGRGLTIQRVTAETSQGKVSGKARSRLAFGATEVADELVLEFERELAAGDAEIDLAYEAPYPEQLRGLFRVEEGNLRYAFTHFEPIDARRAFPCFDEPMHKTPFQVTLRVPKGSSALSNTREVRHSDDPSTGLVAFEFAPSPPLPTYLVAFAVGPLEILEGPKSPVPMRILTAPGKSALGKAAMEIAAALLDLYGAYFDQPYPYEKLDFVAVPNFEESGMENPGLVNFREEILLGERASVSARRELAIGMSHELAHQWFGNFVTLKWWDEIWLNESFAEWLSRKIVDQWQPETKAWLDLVSMKSRAMGQDALPAARKIRNPKRTANEINAYNDLLFYKGGPVIGMVEAWLGPDVMSDGMRRYMKAHGHGTVGAADLYAQLADASGVRDVGKVFDSFVDQTGVPVVATDLVCPSGARNGAAAAAPFVRLKQEEYTSLDRRDPSDKRWRIPVCVRYDNHGQPATACGLLEDAEGRIDLPVARGSVASCPVYLYPNAGEVGYYRFRPARADLERLAARALGKLTESERLGLLTNAWAAVWSGHLPASACFDLLRNFGNETSAAVLSQVMRTLTDALRTVVTDAARPAFAKYVRDVLGPTGRRLGWAAKKDEAADVKRMRADVLGVLGLTGEDPAAIAEAARIADAWLADPAKADGDLAYVALAVRARRNDAAMFDRLLTIVREARDPEVRNMALDALTEFTAPALTRRALDLTLDGTLKSQDMRVVIAPLSRKKWTNAATFAWIEEHFDALAKASTMVPVVLARMPGAACDRDLVGKMEAFLRPRLEKVGAATELAESVEAGLRCAALADKESAPVTAWLAGRGGKR